jgi:glycosyltransferase involved in cell wall biosynthesis
MLVLGGSSQHRGGIESFCERTVTAIDRHGSNWQATWWPTETAYLSWNTLAGLRRAWKRLNAMDKHDIDLVWLQWSTLADLIFLRRIVALGLPVMMTPHLGANARLQRVPLLRALCKRLATKTDRLALLFEEQANEIALPDLPRSTLGTFLPEETLTSPIPVRHSDPLRLLHAGRLSREKGTFRMVEICALLHARGVPFEARIVGSAAPSFIAALDARIADAGLSQSIELIGWMDATTLRETLGHADVLVHLSELDSFPLIVLEALAAGALPIVADMAGAASMVNRYDGLVTPDSSVEAAAQWLMTMAPEAIRQRGAHAALRVRGDHTWPDIVAKLERIAGAVDQR